MGAWNIRAVLHAGLAECCYEAIARLDKFYLVFKKSNGRENVTAKKPEIALAVSVVVHPFPRVGVSISLHWSFVANMPAVNPVHSAHTEFRAEHHGKMCAI